jgi:molybdopterin-guanine dinucleotide biosynthesis protein A
MTSAAGLPAPLLPATLLGANLLGAVLAGGGSTRFGSDKALALLGGQTLLEHAVARLQGWCGAVVAVGRDSAPVTTVPDWPGPGMGPLGGIAGALRCARERGLGGVLTLGVDSLGLPDDLPARLAPGPAYVADQPVVALWPVTALAALEAILHGDGRHSVRALAEATAACRVVLPGASINVNRPEDLAGL